MEIINFIVENELFLEGILTLASVVFPVLIPAAHAFRSRAKIIELINGIPVPNKDIIEDAKGKVSAGTLKILMKGLADAEYAEHKEVLQTHDIPF